MTDLDDESPSDVVITRDTHVKITVNQGKGKNAISGSEDFRVLGIYTKSYNKWYMCELGKQKWSMDLGEGEYRVYARMVRFDHGIGRYEHADPIKSEWEVMCQLMRLRLIRHLVHSIMVQVYQIR